MGGSTSSPPTTPFLATLPVPSALIPEVRTNMHGMEYDYYMISVQDAKQEIIPGLMTPILCYKDASSETSGGSFPGPLIKAWSGRPVAMEFTNNLGSRENTVVHLHGGHIPVEEDGHAMDFILPGESRIYRYPNNQIASTIWFHEHAMDVTATHVYMGLAGLYYITDSVEEALPLPKGEYDVPLVIQDRLFNADGSLNYTLTQHTLMHGMQGDVNLVNGAVQPKLAVDRGKYRFRILNGSNGRFYNLALSNGAPFVQIGTDGGLLPKPVTRSSLYIAPGERIEVILDFAGYKPGTQMVLRNTLGSGRTADVMRFDVSKRSGHTSPVPTFLREFAPLKESEAVQTRTFTLGMDMMSGLFTINGQAYDHLRTDFTVNLNATEIWEFVNPMGMPHPMHAHDIMWQILDRNGAPPPAWEVGWKDTWVVPAKGRVRVIGQFTDYTCDPMHHTGMSGEMVMEEHLRHYMLHCHILEHEDHGMMAQFKVLGEPMGSM